jgi:hypothetical protein
MGKMIKKILVNICEEKIKTKSDKINIFEQH